MEMSPEQERRLITVLERVFDALMRMGTSRFVPAARETLRLMRQRFGDEIGGLIRLSHLAGAYLAISAKHPDKATDSAYTILARYASIDDIMKEGHETSPSQHPEQSRQLHLAAYPGRDLSIGKCAD